MSETKTETTKYRKGSVAARFDALLPTGDNLLFTVRAFELWREAEGGWSVNDSWKICDESDRETVIRHLCNRWEIFQINYIPKAAAKNITDISWEEKYLSLQVDYAAFADIEITKEEE